MMRQVRPCSGCRNSSAETGVGFTRGWAAGGAIDSSAPEPRVCHRSDRAAAFCRVPSRPGSPSKPAPDAASYIEDPEGIDELADRGKLLPGKPLADDCARNTDKEVTTPKTNR